MTRTTILASLARRRTPRRIPRAHVVALGLALTLSVLTIPVALPATLATADAASAPVASSVVETPVAVTTPSVSEARVTSVSGRFQLIGATWARGQHLSPATLLQVRAHTSAGWTDWSQLAESDTMPDAASFEGQRMRGSAEPIWVGDADRAEVRAGAGPTPAGLRLQTIRSDRRAADATPRSTPLPSAVSGVPGAAVAATAARPFAFSRSQWGADDSLKPPDCRTPRYTSAVQAIFVHHTADTNAYAAADVPALLRSIYQYQLANGWCDIAYNAIVDRFGQIWEARSGGLDQPVLSGATGGFNTSTWAVSLLGNFDTASVPPNTYLALRDLIAWRLVVAALDPTGTTVLTQSVGGKAVGARWEDGTSHTFNVISGHRDAVYTVCPGGYAYALLAQLRTDVDVRMASNPLGQVDSITPGFRSFRVIGWTLDPNTYATSYAWIDPGGPVWANAFRPDVNAVYGLGDHHGIDSTVTVPPGDRTVCVYGVNQMAGHTVSIGCRSVSVSASPIGHVDSVTGGKGRITMNGWALDPETSASLYIWVDVSGTGQPVAAGLERLDVSRVYPGVGSLHGFNATISATPGAKRVCTTAVNVGTGGSNTSLGCVLVTVS